MIGRGGAGEWESTTMTINVTHFERRDAADREDLGKTAFALTQALKADDGVHSARFYWANADTIAVMVDTDTDGDTPPNADAARAMFALCDLARQTRNERWLDPGTGERTYRSAGR
jgi:hypothetical protein